MREETEADEPVVEPEEAIPTDMESASEEEFEVSELDEEELAVPIEGEDAVPGLAEAEPLPPEDEDAAMAWLESLAAKQGASEEELLTAPEDRLEEPPDWVQDVAAEGEILEETEPEEKIDSAAAAAMAGLAAGTILSDKEETPAEEILESSSDWVPEVVEEQPESVIEATPTVMEEEDEVGEPMEEQIEPEIQEAAGVDLQPTIEEMPPEPPEEPVETEEEAVIDTDISAEEIPDWLSGLAEDEEVEAEPAAPEWTPAMLVEEETESDVVKEPTEAKIDLNAASLSQLERIPGIGFIHAQRILEYRNQAGSFESLDELEKVHGLSTDMINDIKNYLTVEVVVDEAPPVSSHPDLQGAWTNINEGEIDAAVSQYTELIKRDEHLDEVIRDLQEALVKYPQDASLYQSLGDAYMHSNMLDEALDSYNRAEDLIK
jgi:competence ComEA-like helix-hairpin-helix protein